MSATLFVYDGNLAGHRRNEQRLEFVSGSITVRELIKARIHAEVARYNEKRAEYFTGLIQPTAAVMSLNGYRMQERRPVDPDAQCQAAIRAFEAKEIFVLLRKTLLGTLDDVVELKDDPQVTFIRMAQVVAG